MAALSRQLKRRYLELMQVPDDSNPKWNGLGPRSHYKASPQGLCVRRSCSMVQGPLCGLHHKASGLFTGLSVNANHVESAIQVQGDPTRGEYPTDGNELEGECQNEPVYALYGSEDEQLHLISRGSNFSQG